MDEQSYEMSRSELYEQVWTVPMSKLAKRYGISDVGLAKICKKNSIPRPARGYWARKEAGYKVESLPLPPGDDTIITINSNPFSFNNSKLKDVVSRVISSRDSSHERIVVPERLSNPHPLIHQSSELLKVSQPNDVGLLEPPKKACLDITVSKNSLRRALRIIDTIIKSLEKQGFTVFFSEGFTKTKILDIPVSFGITEKLMIKKKQPKDHGLRGYYEFGHSLFVEERVPSGKLCLTIHDAGIYWRYGCQQNWNDGAKQKLEDRMNSFVNGLVNVAVAKKEHDRQQKDEERQRIERQRQLEEERRKQAELRKRYLEEQVRVTKLISEAEDWKRSQILREYIAEIEKHATCGTLPFSPDKPLAEWLKWAHDQADRLDPLTPSPPSILDEECPEEEWKNEYRYSRW
jgi:hypothetical protein